MDLETDKKQDLSLNISIPPKLPECNPEINNEEKKEEDLFDIEKFLRIAVGKGVSDIHLRTGSPPMTRKDGLIIKNEDKLLNCEDMENIIEKIVPKPLIEKVDKLYDIDFSFEIKGVSRFRVNLLRDLGNIGFVFRIIPFNIPSFETLMLPPVFKNFTVLNNGLVLVTGPTGSGKSTTLSSILDHMNSNYQKHIITLEDPIEFIHKSKKSVFTQRQLQFDTDTFPNGLKYALRQDPDVILIGEMRDRETIISALKAAETGHLVFSTLHTSGAVETINRIINAFEPHERDSVRFQIAASLKGTVSQKLVKRVDRKGRIPATELLIVTPAVRDYIERNEIDKIYELLNTSDYSGMMSMNLSLYKLVRAGLISRADAISASDTPNELEQFLKGAFHGSIT